MKTSPNYIVFNSRDELLKVNLERVVYFEADGNYTKIVITNGLTGMVLTSLGRIEDLLANQFKNERGRFARVGKRYVINLPFIFRINVLKQELTLSDQKSFSFTVPVSRDALKKLKDLMAPVPQNVNKESNNILPNDGIDYRTGER